MGWQITAVVVAIFASVVSPFAAVAFFQGRQKEKVENHSVQLKDLWQARKDDKAAERLARLEGWKDGMDATLRMLEKKREGEK